jgi:hypothetical protein
VDRFAGWLGIVGEEIVLALGRWVLAEGLVVAGVEVFGNKDFAAGSWAVLA